MRITLVRSGDNNRVDRVRGIETNSRGRDDLHCHCLYTLLLIWHIQLFCMAHLDTYLRRERLNFPLFYGATPFITISHWHSVKEHNDCSWDT